MAVARVSGANDDRNLKSCCLVALGVNPHQSLLIPRLCIILPSCLFVFSPSGLLVTSSFPAYVEMLVFCRFPPITLFFLI